MTRKITEAALLLAWFVFILAMLQHAMTGVWLTL